jgi:tetratricopeptide (TPR) repeat protein
MTEPGPDTIFRVFISAPDDVAAERAAAERVLDEVAAEFGGRLGFAMLGGLTQDRPSAADLVVCILWKGLGEALPAPYDRPDGTPRTGLEYEFEDALESALAAETPDILVYKKRVLIDAEHAEAAAADLRALNAFWQKWFRDENGHFTASFDGFETAAEFADKLRRHVRQWLLRRRQDVTWPVELKGSPYRSLEPFEAEHAGVFFGRRRAIRQVVARLAAASARGCGFLVLLGGSGTGKSSLARAGIIPFLAEHGVVPEVAEWRAAALRPAALGEDAVAGLARILFQPGALPELAASDYPTPERFAAMAGRSAEAAAILVSGILRQAHGGREARLVLLIDQLEELLARPAGAPDALVALVDALARTGRVWVIATLRSDRYPAFQASPGLLRLKQDGDSFDLLPPDHAEIREIIEGPARAAGLTLEESAERSLATLLEDAAQARGALPLLQFTLHRLFLERDSGDGMLLLSVYDRLGGIAGAIAGEAEKTVAGLPEHLKAALPRLLINLVDVEDGKAAAGARTLKLAELGDADIRALAERLVEGRFLVLDGGGAEARLRLAHEALLTRWPVLAELVRDHGAFLAARNRLGVDAANWAARDRHPDFLLPAGRRLAEAAEALAQHRADLDHEVAAYIEASIEAERVRAAEREAEERRRLELRAEAAEIRERAASRLVARTRIAAGIVSVLLVAMIAVAGLWLSQLFLARAREASAEKNYATALKAASAGVDVVSRARTAGQMPNDVASELLEVNRETFDQLGAGQQTADALGTQAEMLDQVAQAEYFAGKFAAALETVHKELAIATQLAEREPDTVKWQWTLIRAHEQLGQWSEQAGDLPQAVEQYRLMTAIADRLTTKLPDDQSWKNWKSLALAHQGDTARARGDLPAAIGLYHQALDRFAAGGSAPFQLYLVAATRLALARAIVQQGDIAGSAEQRRMALEIFKAQGEQDKSNHNWPFLIAFAEAELGDSLRLQGDLDGAYKLFQDSITLEMSLSNADDSNFQFQNNLAAAGRGKGDVFLDEGQTDKALTLYRLVVQTIQRLADSDPVNGLWQRNLGQMHGRVGDALMDKKDRDAAEQEFRGGLEVIGRIAAKDPSNAEVQRELSLAHARLGGVLHAKGDTAGALAEERARMDILKRLTRLDPTNVTWRRDIAASHGRLGLILSGTGDAPGAHDEFAACAAIPKPVPDSDTVYNRGEDLHDFCEKQLGSAQ